MADPPNQPALPGGGGKGRPSPRVGADPDSPKPALATPGPGDDRRATRLGLLTGALFIVCFAVILGQHRKPSPALPDAALVPLPALQEGVYATVADVGAGLTVRLMDGRQVRPGGLAAPASDAEAAALEARARQLVLTAKAPVYVDLALEGEPDADGVPVTSIWLPPPDLQGPYWFPNPKMELLGAALIREGLARADREALYLFKNELLMLEDDARRHRRGLWAAP